MPGPRAVLDACTIYSNLRRDVFMWLAVHDVYEPKWTNKILDEWIGRLAENNPTVSREKLERTRGKMNIHAEQALIPEDEYTPLIAALSLPDADDRHVLAAAIASGSQAIVTMNLKDFPKRFLPADIEAIHPDEFLQELLHSSPVEFCAAVKECRVNMARPARQPAELIAALSGPLAELPRMGADLLSFSDQT
jgi:predicted nucleic acid-binding protein